MPERPKRRKNKNKRKNKNNRSDSNKHMDEVKQVDLNNDTDINSESCSVQNATSASVVDEQTDTSASCSNSNESKPDQTTNESNNHYSFTTSQDLNNNSHVPDILSPNIEPERIEIPNSESYVVESPEQSVNEKFKLGSNFKSKSLDNDNEPKIIEITEASNSPSEVESTLAVENSNVVIVSDIESDVEWEKSNDFQDKTAAHAEELATGTISIANVPLNVAQCEETKTLTPEAERSLRKYLETLDLSTQPSNISTVEIRTEIEEIINREVRHRLRKKGVQDDFPCPRLAPPRMLDVIDEEGSSESSLTSRRHSHFSDKKSDIDDLDDDVFEDNNKTAQKYATKSVNLITTKSFGRQIPQECFLVGTKLKDSTVSEARGDWSFKTAQPMTNAEVVYLTDSSSSTSSIYECGETDEGGETDVSVRMITPTIEVTDTESFLKKSFILNDHEKKQIDSKDNPHILNCNKTEDSSNNSHEIVILSTDNIKTDLYVKDIDEPHKKCVNSDSVKDETSTKLPKSGNYDLEIKVLKCELNDAINNLIKEVSSDSEICNENIKDNFTRQDSSSSVCSSQCTAKYNPNFSSLTDVSNTMHEDTCEINKLNHSVLNDDEKRHVKDVFQYVAGATTQSKAKKGSKNPLALRDLCVRKIATLPYGEKILEELAAVSQRLQSINVKIEKPNDILNNSHHSETNLPKEMPYFPLPDVSSIETVSLKTNHKTPPPIQPRNSSLKITHDEQHWTGLPTKTEPVYVCLSPSQKMLMEKTNTVITKEDASQLVDMHKKFVDRRGYNEQVIKNDIKNSEEHIENSSVIPFKSQTGSRLLALIRDPAVTTNISSPINKPYHRSVDNLQNHHYSQKEMMSKKIHDQFNSIKSFTSSFKPIPPPRPRKYSSTFYESDESSDFTDNSFRSIKSERKYFHYSTGNLSKEIENEVSSIQNMHRNFRDIREQMVSENCPRRPSLPKDICEQQMEYIRQKEKEVEAEIKRLEEKKNNIPAKDKRSPRAPLISEKEFVEEKIIDKNNYFISRKRDFALKTQDQENPVMNKLSSVFSSSQEEILRDKMYSEYVNQMAERQERKEHKVIKITNPTGSKSVSKSMSALDILDSKVNNRIEKEFISKARERWNKLGIKDPETEDERDKKDEVYEEPKVIEHKIKVIEGGKERDVQKLPSHLQDFVRFTAKDKEQGAGSSAVWRPGTPPAPTPQAASGAPSAPTRGAPSPSAPTRGAPSPSAPPPPPPPVWTPASAGASPQAPRKNFRPVHFEDTPPARRKFPCSEQNGCTSGSESESRLRTSFSAPASGLNTLGGSTGRLPKAQNPTVTLLQKAREGQIPRGSQYLDQEGARLPRDRPAPPRGDPVYALRKGYASEGEAERSDYERGGVRKMADAHRKVDGIGPTTKDGMPVALRSEVKDPSRWYKKMYDTIHKNKYDDDYVTIRYKSRRGEPPQRVTNKSQYAYFDPRSGYLSEPEGGLSSRVGSSWSDAYDSDITTGPRRRTASVQEERRSDDVGSPYLPSNKYSTLASAKASQEVYKNQPGRIENYVPGKSSVVEKEAKQWWDEVMDIFDGWLDDNSPLPPYTTLLARAIQKSQNNASTTSLPQASPKERKDLTSTILSKSNMARALKESGYESDSTLVFRRRDDSDAPLSPAERRAAYRDLQAGGEPPLRGFRSPAPPRTDETEIEYIPISPTLTKIRVHKKTPQHHEVICYPVTGIETDAKTNFKKQIPSFIRVNVPNKVQENPPAPPRRISSRNSRTLRLVTSTRPVSSSPKRSTVSQSTSNVDFLRDRISHKLTRQNTHTIIKKSSTDTSGKIPKGRVMSTSAPPALNRKKITSSKNLVKCSFSETKTQGTSSFCSPRRTLLPTEYSKYGESTSSVAIEGGAGRRTPISNILDKVTSLDKLWSSEKRNERIDLTKAKSKSVMRINNVPQSKINTKSSLSPNIKTTSSNGVHRSRDMTRTAEKVQRLKISNIQTKSNPCLATKNYKPSSFPTSSNISKSSSSISPVAKKANPVKTALVTNIKKRKTTDTVVARPRSVPCHESCSKKSNDAIINAKKVSKPKSSKKESSKSPNNSETGSQFGDISNEISYFGSFENLNRTNVSAKEIRKTRDAVLSDSFFQHLFLGGFCIPSISTYPYLEPNTTVLQKAKMFQSYPPDNIAPKSLNTYLIQRKPVTLSRFKLWDRHPTPSRAQSPRSISWPGRSHVVEKKYDSLSKCEEFGSTSSLATVRSKSEPPINKMYFSQTSRPISPTVLFYKKPREHVKRREISPSKIIFSQTSRPVSPTVTRKVKHPPLSYSRNQSLSPTRIVLTETVRPISPLVTKQIIPNRESSPTKSVEERHPPMIFFSETSRPVSPKVTKNKSSTSVQSRSHSTSPVSIRSPSYRRIHSVRQHGNGKLGDIITKGVLRTRSAGDAGAERKLRCDNLTYKTKSDSNLQTEDPEYDEYLQDMQSNRARSERFRELNRYYAYLERVGELEKATSSCDLRHRRKDEEIIDFERWKKIRAIERAEDELHSLYLKLKIAQNENDVLFYPRDLEDFRWKYDRDRGLRIKEKSVEDLKDHFQQISDYDSLDVDPVRSKDTYKPLWRGTSVAETAFNINRKNENITYEKHAPVKPVLILHQDTPLSELRKKIGLGNRLWSSLSMEQVNALKNQLNAIYSRELESKSNKETNENYTIDVKANKGTPSLHVRSTSLISTSKAPDKERVLSKSESIAAISCPVTSVKELKNNVNKIQMSLSENEKRKISQTLSKEILDRLNKFENTPSLKEEIENAQLQSIHAKSSTGSKSSKSSEETVRIEDTEEKEGTTRHVVYPSEKTETQQSSASETETASSDVSNKTVIYRGPKKEVQKKVEYFESVKSQTAQSKVIYHARESSDETDKSMSVDKRDTSPVKNQMVQSQSCTNIKELFGESEKNKFLSLPMKPDLYSRSPSPHSEVYVTERRTPDTLRYSSDETVWRSRSPSPDPERYWRAYLNLARAGEVRRLARRFDSPTAAAAVLRRHTSDPELSRNANLAKWPSDERLHRRRGAMPVTKVPLRPKNRFMPHIDVISKLASLRRRTVPRSRSAEEPSECRSGEVERIRRRFETMSLLGQIYSSAPDVSELRDIASHLAGPWTAHRFPKRSDNNRSIQDPNVLVRGRTSPVKKEVKRPVPKESVKLSSILKSDVFAKQDFDPSLHRPASRYEPPRAPPRPPPAAWPYRLAPYVTPSRHTVTFQG